MYGRNHTAQVVRFGQEFLLLDCGEGTQIQLRKFKAKTSKISTIFISHLHGDHFFGLVGLISTMRLMGRDKNLVIYGPVGLEMIVRTQLEIGDAKLDFEIEFVELDGKTSRMIYEDNLIEIHTFPLKHRIPTNGFLIKEKIKERKLNSSKVKGSGLLFEHLHRLKSGEDIITDDGKVFKNEDYTLPPNPSRSYAYCSDTAYYEDLLPHVQGVDLLYHEATFIEKEKSII